MFTPSSFPCVAWRISQRTHTPIPVVIEEPYQSLYQTDQHSFYLCDVAGCGSDAGIYILHASELFESCFLAQLHCRSTVAEREDRRYKLVECNVPTGSEVVA